jgi:hypothetical protein
MVSGRNVIGRMRAKIDVIASAQAIGWQLIAIHVNLLNPTGYGMHQQVEYFSNCTLCPSVFMCFLFI